MARIVNFTDGAESETTPVIGNIVASNLVKYPDDATYEATELGAPATGNIYYNTTDDVIRYYNGTSWMEVVDEATIQNLENKVIDADNNTITNIDNNEIKPLAGIEATKIADGSVDNTEFQHLNGVTSGIQGQLDAKIPSSEKGAANGVATLDGSGLVPSGQLPSYVDDVLEFANLASFPVTGETGKIYVALDTNLTYRWTGSIYVQISSGVDQLSDLTDVDTTGVTDGQALIYNQGAGEWQPGSVSSLAQENIALIGKGNASWNVNVGGFTNSTSLLFDGVNEYATTGGTPSAELGSNITSTFTAAAWIKNSVADGVYALMGQWDIFNSQAKWALILSKSAGTPTLRLAVSNNGSAASVVDQTSGLLDDNVWVHIAVTYDGGANEVKHYVNGVQIGSTAAAPYATLHNSTFDFRLASIINGAGGNTVYPGNIDEPAVFNTALNGTQISELYNSGAAFDLNTHSASANLVGWWHFDGDTFPTNTDEMGFNNLTMTNMEAGDLTADAPPGSVTTTKQLILDSNCFVSVPPLADDRHRILAQTINIEDGQCAYITLDRGATTVTNRAVTVDDITNVTPDNNKLILARNVGDECYFGIHDPTRLTDGDSVEIQRTQIPTEANAIVESSLATTSAGIPAVGQWGDMVSVVLTPGTWDLVLHTDHVNGATTDWLVGISSTAGNVSPGSRGTDYVVQSYGGAVSGGSNVGWHLSNVTVVSNTTYYAKVQRSTSNGQQWGGKLTARKIV